MRAALLTHLSLKSPSCTGFTLRATRVQANLESSAAAGFMAAERSEVRVSGWRRRPWSERRWGWHRADSGGWADGNTACWTSDGTEPDPPAPERERERHLVRPLHRQHPTPSVWRMVYKVERNMMPASKMPWFNRENNTRMHCNKLRKKIKDGKILIKK